MIVETIDSVKFVSECYEDYGGYVNSTRAVTGYDGLKSVERRVLLAVRDVASSKLTGSADVMGRTITKYHPHGDASCYPVLVKFVHKGFVEGKGNFGVPWSLEAIQAAAYRYTKVKASDAFNRSVFKLIDYVPHFENEFGMMEPSSLPVPIPLALTTSSRGIGLGLLNLVPSFSSRSLFEAMLSNDPMKLKAPEGIHIVNQSDESIRQLWEQGSGQLTYGLKCYTEWHPLDDKMVSVITGNSKLFRPNIYEIFEKELLEKSVYIRDESDKFLRIIVSRVKGLRRISDDQVHEKCLAASLNVMPFKIYVTENGVSKRISLKSWLTECWTRYQGYVEDYKNSSLVRLTRKKDIIELIPLVYPMIVEGKTSEAIAAKLSTPIDLIKEIEGKPLRILRKTEFTSELLAIANEMIEISKITSKQLANDLIDVLELAQSK